MAGTPSAVAGQAVDHINVIASQYLAMQKNWRLNQFRLEQKGLTADGQAVIVWAIYLEDELHPTPGGGKSVELYIDLTTQKVVRELGFQ